MFVLLGLALVFVAGFHLLPAIFTGKIPSRWPVHPLTYAAKPVQYTITFCVFLVAGAVGLGLLVAALVRDGGL